jgi:hypothetical protein
MRDADMVAILIGTAVVCDLAISGTRGGGLREPLSALLRCGAWLGSRVKYVFDTLFMAARISLRFHPAPPQDTPCTLYALLVIGPRHAVWCAVGGSASMVVWHLIVFVGARNPG